jgi:hypothetical protein
MGVELEDSPLDAAHKPPVIPYFIVADGKRGGQLYALFGAERDDGIISISFTPFDFGAAVQPDRPNRRLGLKVEAQRQLPCAVSAVLRGLGRLQDSKCARVAHIHSRRRKVGMVQRIRKSCFKADSQPFANHNRL